MKKLSVMAGMVLALLVAVMPVKAQDETPGQQVTITVVTPYGGQSCGRASYPLYCYGVPTNVGGTFWMDVYYTQQTGFILFNGVADLGQAKVTVATVTRNAQGFVNSVHLEFTGLTNDGDNDTYIGTGDFTFSYIKMSGGSGRGGGYPGYLELIQSGTLVITYN